MTGPIPDPESGTLNTRQVLEQQDVLSAYLKENKVAFTLQYVPATQYWSGLFVNHGGGKSACHIGRYPVEVIYLLLKEVTE